MPWTVAEPAPDADLTRAFEACLPGGRLAGPLRAYRCVASTQTVARRWADAGAPEGAVVVADHQTAGRGRRGRPWTSPPGCGLLFTVLLRPSVPPARWPELGLAAGCAVAEALERAAGAAPRLKWPNDVLLAGRKVAGILAEGIVGTRPVVLLGIGVNVARPGRDDWPPELSRRATALAAHATAVARERVLRAILDRLAAWYDVLLTEGFPPVREAWRRRAVLGSRVAGPGGPGLAVDLAAGGELVVRHRDGRTSVLVAEPLEAPAHDGVPAPVSGRG